MESLHDLLRAARERIVGAWIGGRAFGLGSTPDLYSRALADYDCLLDVMQDESGAAYRVYIEEVVKPEMRAGLTPGDLHDNLSLLFTLITTELERTLPDAAARRTLVLNLDLRLRRLDALAETIAAQLALETVRGAAPARIAGFFPAGELPGGGAPASPAAHAPAGELPGGGAPASPAAHAGPAETATGQPHAGRGMISQPADSAYNPAIYPTL